VEYSVGFPIKNAAAISTIARLPARSWTPAVAADGEVRVHADVAEIMEAVTGAWV